MDDRQQFTVMDVLNIISFYIGMKNLDLNFTQDTAGKMLDIVVNDIHAHLNEQDKKLALIMQELGVEYNEKDKNVS